MLRRPRGNAAAAHARDLGRTAGRAGGAPRRASPCWRAPTVRPPRPRPWARNSPTFAARLEAQRAGIERVAILGKMNGAVGNFNAHVAALPQVDWLAVQRRFRRIAGPRIERLHHADRAARLDRRILSCADARQHRAVGFRARHVELYLARATSSSVWSPAKSAPRPCRTR